MSFRRLSWLGLGLGTLAVAALLGSSGCSSTYPRRDPTGERFPSVTGEALSGEQVSVPDDFLGEPSLFLVGYDQDTQFDIDRWLVGLVHAKVDLAVRELPTIPGMVPRWFSGFIDDGMRSGIPQESWGAVVTLSDDAEPVAKFTGNDERRRNARVLLLDAEGKVLWFWDQGHSAQREVELVEAIRALDRD